MNNGWIFDSNKSIWDFNPRKKCFQCNALLVDKIPFTHVTEHRCSITGKLRLYDDRCDCGTIEEEYF